MTEGDPVSSGRAGEESGRELALDRAELDQVIRRAIELQVAGADEGEGDRISEAEVLRIGREVGLAPQHLRRALGELRAESLAPVSPEGEGVMSWLVGAPRVRATRVVPGAPDDLMPELEEYLQLGESLRKVRKRGYRSRWEAAQGFVASLQRGLNWGGRRYDLARTRSVELSLEAVDAGHCLVALVADLSSVRTEAGAGWMVGLGLGGLGLGLGLGAIVSLPVLAVPGVAAGVGGGLLAARRDYAGRVERVRLALEGILDRLEGGEALLAAPPSWRNRWLQGNG